MFLKKQTHLSKYITLVPESKLALAHKLQGSHEWDGRAVQRQQQIWVCPWTCPSLHMRSYVSDLCLCVCGSGRVPCFFLNVMFLKLFWLWGAPQTSKLGGEGTPQLAPKQAPLHIDYGFSDLPPPPTHTHTQKQREKKEEEQTTYGQCNYMPTSFKQQIGNS